MKIALLGDSRFIGVSAADAAVRSGHDVTMFHSGKYPTALRGADYRAANLGDAISLREHFQQGGFDALIDTFAMTRQNAEVASRAAAGVIPRVVVLSSQDVYAQFGHILGHAIESIEATVTERSPLTIPYPYRGIAKHAGGEDYDKKLVEEVYRQADVASIAILRLPAVYGHRDTKRRFGWIVDRLDRGQRTLPLRAGGQWRWTHGFINDISAAIVAAAEGDAPGCTLMNLGDRETPTMREWAEHIARRMQVDICWSEAQDLPQELSYLGVMPCDFVADSQLSW